MALMCIEKSRSVLVSKNMDWRTAAKYCKRKFRGSLQVVRSAEEQKKIGKMLSEADGR